jgi:hypothetical protein
VKDLKYLNDEILRGVYPEAIKKRFFATLRMTTEGRRKTNSVFLELFNSLFSPDY